MAYVTVTSEGREICRRELTANLLLGRARECDISIADPRLSRKHCLLEAAGNGQWFVVDLDSRNGTLFNGEAVVRRLLRDGEELAIGNTTVRFREGDFVAARPASPLDDLALRPSPLIDADTNIPGAAATLVAAAPIASSAHAATARTAPAPMPQSSDSTVGGSPQLATARPPRVMAAPRVPPLPPQATAVPAHAAAAVPAPPPMRLWLLLAGAGLLIVCLVLTLVILLS